MDGSSFDRIARALGTGVSRRSGLLGALSALGAALPGIGGVAAGGKGNGKDKGQGQRGPGIAGPCGKGKKPNVCKQNSDCCTNICKTKIKNKDKTGRCRCEKKGRPCSEDRNCCGSISCVAGKCGGKAPLVATGDACGPNDVCRDPNAECTTYDFDTPAGTYCLLPVMGLCTAGSECVSSRCMDGSCRPCSVSACIESCTPIVCASCTHQTVQAAIDAASDGDVIAIGKGTYVEDLVIASKALTLRACPGERVTLRNATRDASGSGKRTIAVTGGKSLTVLDITVDGYQDWENDVFGGGIGSDGNVTLAGTTVVKNAGWRHTNSAINYGGALGVSGDGLTVTVTDDVVVRGNYAWNPGGGVGVVGASDLVVSGWAVIADNITDSYGGGVGTAGAGVNVTISGHVRITGNAATNDYAGGGVGIANFNSTRAVTVIIEGDVVIAENTSVDGSGMGGGVFAQGVTGATVTVLIRDRVQIIGNTVTDFGGGVAFVQWVTATISGEVEISGNTALTDNGDNGFGGGVYVSWEDNDQPADWTHLTITDSVQVSDNTAVGGGGGIYVFDTKAAVEGSAVISGNTAAKGGGVAIDNPSAVTVSGSATITGNTATDSAPSGGGVWAESNSSTLTAVTGSITGNTPDQCAGGTISC